MPWPHAVGGVSQVDSTSCGHLRTLDQGSAFEDDTGSTRRVHIEEPSDDVTARTRGAHVQLGLDMSDDVGRQPEPVGREGGDVSALVQGLLVWQVLALAHSDAMRNGTGSAGLCVQLMLERSALTVGDRLPPSAVPVAASRRPSTSWRSTTSAGGTHRSAACQPRLAISYRTRGASHRP